MVQLELLVQQDPQEQKVLKVLIFMPFAISFVGAGIIWKFVYDFRQGDQIGILNAIVTAFGGQLSALDAVIGWLDGMAEQTKCTAGMAALPTVPITVAPRSLDHCVRKLATPPAAAWAPSSIANIPPPTPTW